MTETWEADEPRRRETRDIVLSSPPLVAPGATLVVFAQRRHGTWLWGGGSLDGREYPGRRGSAQFGVDAYGFLSQEARGVTSWRALLDLCHQWKHVLSEIDTSLLSWGAPTGVSRRTAHLYFCQLAERVSPPFIGRLCA